MTQKHLFILFFLGLSISAYTQDKHPAFENKLIEYFKAENWQRVVGSVTRDSLYVSPYRDKYWVLLSRNCFEFDTAHFVIRNPYFSQKYEAGSQKDNVRNFPRSFSVIYENDLVSLFENGKFACFDLGSFERDTVLEAKLNTREFKYHWIINGQLGGLSGASIFVWNGRTWVRSKDAFPLKNRPKLFEDDKFIVYCDCSGEFGGTVYFFEKATSKTYFTESTCAVSVTKNSNGYNVLANLGHMAGSAEVKKIPDPTKLTFVNPNDIGRTVKGSALGYSDSSKAFQQTMEFYGLQIFSTFRYKERVLYIVHLLDLTFIAEIKGQKIEIVNPLFFNGLYTHEPVTSIYGKTTLVNLDFYGTGLNREISVLIINGNKITQLDWNAFHNR